VEAAFAEANRSGGVRGRELTLVVLDDGYEPNRAAENMNALIEKHAVVGVVGNVGTPTAVAAVPIAVRNRTLFFAPVTGAGVVRSMPPERYVFNYRASYAEETSAIVTAMVLGAGIPAERVGFFTQRDAFGDSGFDGGRNALRFLGMSMESRIAHGRYERGSLAVENGLADLLLHEPSVKGVLFVGTFKPCARMIIRVRENSLGWFMAGVSFVVSEALAEELGPRGDGVFVTQVVPHFESDWPVVRAYRSAMQASHPASGFSFASLEGYAAGRILLLALNRYSGEPTRESMVEALEGLGDFDIGMGVPLHLSAGDHQACHTVWPTVLKSGKTVPASWDEILKYWQGAQ
jgi:ABC-type branched-subunit amino acid transport system substrate-binding protein